MWLTVLAFEYMGSTLEIRPSLQ